jgi:hypothetical protein
MMLRWSAFVGAAAAVMISATVASAQYRPDYYPGRQFDPALNGGGSIGYNRMQEQDLRLKQHPTKRHIQHHQAPQ